MAIGGGVLILGEFVQNLFWPQLPWAPEAGARRLKDSQFVHKCI